MVILRVTRKMLKMLPMSADDTDTSDTALGDWYVKRLVVDRQPLLLFVCAKSLLSIIAPARDVKTIPQRFPNLVADRLTALGVAPELIAAEKAAMDRVRVGKTEDRSVLGYLVDFGKSLPYYLPIGNWGDAEIRRAEELLAEIPCRLHLKNADEVYPNLAAPRLLRDKWGR